MKNKMGLFNLFSRNKPQQTLFNKIVTELSNREKEVYELLNKNKPIKEIAGKLNISSTSVHVYKSRIKQKLTKNLTRIININPSSI